MYLIKKREGKGIVVIFSPFKTMHLSTVIDDSSRDSSVTVTDAPPVPECCFLCVRIIMWPCPWTSRELLLAFDCSWPFFVCFLRKASRWPQVAMTYVCRIAFLGGLVGRGPLMGCCHVRIIRTLWNRVGLCSCMSRSLENQVVLKESSEWESWASWLIISKSSLT